MTPAAQGRAPLSAWIALAVLLLIGLYTYMDRPLLTLLTEPIRRSLMLSDFQIGLVMGLSWALFGALFSYPAAWLADRFGRRPVIAIALMLWCVAAIGTGLSHSFAQIFAAGALIGAAEAALLPITYALIPELFTGQARVLANALVIALGRFGSGLVYAACGWLAANAGGFRPSLPPGWQAFEPWRIALIVLALPAPLLALAAFSLKLTPATGASSVRHGPPMAAWPFLSRHIGTFAPFWAGVGLLVFAMAAFMSFLPVVMMREMGASQLMVGGGMGVATLVAMGAALAVTLGGSAVLKARFGQRQPIFLLFGCSALSALVAPLFLLATSPVQFFWLIGAVFMLLSVGAMAFPTALQELTPQPARTRLIAIVILVNLLMSGLGQPVAGFVSDRIGDLRLATVLTGMVALAVSALALLMAARGYNGTADDARAVEAGV